MSLTFLKRDNSGTFLIPGVFVWLWSTGFVSAKYALPYAEPFTILAMRMLLTLAVLAVIIQMSRAPWPTDWASIFHSAVVGVSVHVAYLGGVFSAIQAGMPAGVSAVITGVQPIATAIFAALWLGALLSFRQIVGLALGFAGIVCVLLGNHLMELANLTSGLNLESVIYASIALMGISFGTFYQKRFCSQVPLMSGAFFQYLITAVVTGILAFSLETRTIEWTLPLVLSILWLVFGLSIIAILLLLYMIRQGKVEKVASLFYLVPPVTALETFLLFDERLNWISILGIFITVLGVYLSVSVPQAKANSS